MRIRKIFFICVLILTATIARAGEIEDLAALLEARNFAPETSARIMEQVRAARENGLPLMPVIDKVHEGLAKQVEPARIAQAVEQVCERYSYAYTRTRGLFSDREQAAQAGNMLAEAMAAGLSRQDAGRITDKLAQREKSRDTVHDGLVPETLQTARDMARYGVSSQTLTGTVTNALGHFYSGNDMATMRANFARQARFGSPEMIARQFSNSIGAGHAAGSLGTSAGAGFGAGYKGGGMSSGGGARGGGRSGGRGGGH